MKHHPKKAKKTPEFFEGFKFYKEISDYFINVIFFVELNAEPSMPTAFIL